MRKKENQKAEKLSQSYKKSSQKSSSKGDNWRKKAASKIINNRTKRWENALHALDLPELFTELGLKKNNDLVCPFCKSQNTIQLDHSKDEFSCASCKKTGTSIKLVKQVRQITDWQAIYYIEDLQKKKQDTSFKTSDEEFRERIENIKNSNSLKDVISRETGASFTPSGDKYICSCPFHDHKDKTPSFTVYPKSQSFKCFGCGKSGDVLSFIEQYKNMSFPQVLEYFEGSTLPVITPTHPVKEPIKEKENEQNHPLTPFQIELISNIQNFFHKSIAEARAFLAKRKLDNPELINYFKLGFDNGSINQTFTEEVRNELALMGFLSEKNNSRFYQCLTLGLENDNGQTVGIYGRRIQTEKGSIRWPNGHFMVRVTCFENTYGSLGTYYDSVPKEILILRNKPYLLRKFSLV